MNLDSEKRVKAAKVQLIEHQVKFRSDKWASHK